MDFARPRKCWHCLGVPGGEAGSFAPEFAALPRGHSIAKGPQQLLGETLGEQGAIGRQGKTCMQSLVTDNREHHMALTEEI